MIDTAYLNKALKFYEIYESNWNSKDWQLTLEDEQQQLKIWQRSANGLKAMKAAAFVDHSPEEIAILIFDSDKKKEYDKTYDSSKMLLRVAH